MKYAKYYLGVSIVLAVSAVVAYPGANAKEGANCFSCTFQNSSNAPLNNVPMFLVSKQQSSPAGSEPHYPCNPTRWTIQARAAAFMPLKHQLRRIYCDGLPTMELQSSYSLMRNLCGRCDQLLLWGNVGWTTKRGHSIGFGYESQLNLIPFSIGLDYQVSCASWCDFYVGAGPTFSLLRIKNFDGFYHKFYNRNAFGVTTKTGFRFTFCTNYFFDIFADYYYTKFRKMHDSIQNVDNNFSGFFVGAGFGGKW